MCLTYESVFEPLEIFAETRTVTVPVAKVAAEYERCHFIGHALYNPGLSKESLLEYAGTIEDDIAKKTGYKAYLVDIRIQHYPPGMTDVNIIIDVPKTKSLGRRSLGPIDPLTLIAIIAICAVLLGFIVWLFWTTYIEKVKLYYCDQESPPSVFEGWLQYVAHLKEKHPTKYSAVEENKSQNWWEKIPETIKWVVGGVVAVAAISVIIELVRRR